MKARTSIFAERMVPVAGVRLWLGSAIMEGPVRAEVLVTHGMGEHASRYEHVAARLAASGLRLHAYDLRGHGRSGGRRGDADRYELLVEDLESVRAAVASPGRPLFLMGHSLGGQVTLRYLLDRPEACRGAVIASPWLRLAFNPQRWRLALARLARHVWPAWRQGTPIAPEQLSRDVAHLGSLASPELVHHLISVRLFFEISESANLVLEEAGRLRTPVLLLHGGADPVTSAPATREFYERAGSIDKTYREFPDARHETHNDLGREQVLDEMAGWMLARAAVEEAVAP